MGFKKKKKINCITYQVHKACVYDNLIYMYKFVRFEK